VSPPSKGEIVIVVTGAQGFIGSTMVSHLNSMGIDSIIGVDDLSIDTNNLRGCKLNRLHPISVSEADILPSGDIEAVFHFGAISNTLERDVAKMHHYNTLYTQVLNKVCKQRCIPLIFSSTAAIYGNGSGTLNLYAQSKLESENEISDHAVCLRLFNVYGQRESHKGRMASVAFKWLQELRETNTIRIFENSNQYMRDFVFVDDVCKTAYTLLSMYKPGVYDLGSGVSRSFE
jgi:ADP-L-glycero-D-manno-heptose 6-epimerase